MYVSKYIVIVMERRTRAKKPSKISVTHYLNKRVKPVMEESPLEGEEGVMLENYPLYYYVTIRRRTIHRASITELMLSERDSIESIRGVQKEAETIKSICAMYLNDLERNKVDKDIIENINPKTKDRFVAELNAYIKYWTGSVATELWKLFHFEVKPSISKKYARC